jgi:hypothetical protein
MDLTIDNSDGDDARFGWAGFLADAKGDCQSIDLPGPKGEVTVEVLGKQKFRLPLKAARPVPAAKDATLLVIVSHSDLPAGVWLKAGGASGAKDNKPPVKPPSDNGDF